MSFVFSTSDPAGADAVEELEPPPRGALVLAGANIVYAVGLLIGIGIGVAPAADWQRPLGGPLMFTLDLFPVVLPVLLITSVVSLVGVRVRSAPRIHRVLLAATVVLVLVFATFLYLPLNFARFDCGSSGGSLC